MKTVILIHSPFKARHCVPLAFASCSARPTPAMAQDIAVMARVRGILSSRGSSHATGIRRATWASLAGLKIVESFVPNTTVRWDEIPGGRYTGWQRRRIIGRPTLAAFIQAHPTGRWVVMTRGHAQAVVDGVLVQAGTARSRVIQAWRLEEA